MYERTGNGMKGNCEVQGLQERWALFYKKGNGFREAAQHS